MILIAITGASGFTLGVRLLETLKSKNMEVELIISKVAKTVMEKETDYNLQDVYKLATKSYDVDDLAAPPASGSHKIKTMIIVPCTMKTLAAIANGYSDNLITRAADVTIKERRKLILVVRESIFSVIHLENMLRLAKLGVIITPPVPSYYIKPKSVDELINHTVGRILDQIGIESDIKRWGDE